MKWSTSEGAESCPERAQISEAVAQLLSSERLTALDDADRLIFARARHDDAWRATLRVVDKAGSPLGERELKSDAPTCTELGASVALAIALIIDPEHVAAGVSATTLPRAPGEAVAAFPSVSAPEPPPRAPDPAPTASPLPVLDSPAAKRPSVSPERWMVYGPRPQRTVKAGAVLLSGLLPELALGAQIELWQPVWAADSLRFSLAYFAAQTRAVPNHADASATLYVATARAAYCPSLAASRRISVFGCAGLESGFTVARAQGGGYRNTPARALLALDGALSADYTLAGRWLLGVTTGAALTPFRPEFSYLATSGRIEVARRSALEGRLEFALGYRF